MTEHDTDFTELKPSPMPVVSASPPSGMVTIKGKGWRFSLPIVVLVSIASAAGARLVSTEQRLAEQKETIATLRAQLAVHCK